MQVIFDVDVDIKIKLYYIVICFTFCRQANSLDDSAVASQPSLAANDLSSKNSNDVNEWNLVHWHIKIYWTDSLKCHQNMPKKLRFEQRWRRIENSDEKRFIFDQRDFYL
jgi:hypothetical protein